MMNKLLTGLLFILCTQICAAQNFAAINNWLNNNSNNLGGRAVVLIYKDGKIIYDQSINKLTVKQKIGAKWLAKKTGKAADLNDFNSNTKIRIASCSKWLSAALAMTFIDSHQLSLNDSIGKFLPIMTAHGKGNIKVWHCLSHLTGIKQVGIAATMKGNDSDNNNDEEQQHFTLTEKLEKLKTKGNESWNSMNEAMDSIAIAPMEGEAGKTFHYGNAGLQIIAAIIEKIENKKFETIFQERIAQPLQMNNTDFGNNAVPLAAGGAWSTPNDYLNFLQMILNNGMFNGKQILTKESIAAMQKNYVTTKVNVIYSPNEAGNWGYGFGEWTMNENSANERSTAVTSPGLFGTFPWVDNEKKYCAILFTFNMKSKGRNERYKELKHLVDEAFNKK